MRLGGGFLVAKPDALVRPVISEGEFSYHKVNVALQRHDEDSLLSWLESAIHNRNQYPEIGYGDCEILDVGDERVFAHRFCWESGEFAALHNFADKKGEGEGRTHRRPTHTGRTAE